jgi:hypothetical protein
MSEVVINLINLSPSFITVRKTDKSSKSEQKDPCINVSKFTDVDTNLGKGILRSGSSLNFIHFVHYGIFLAGPIIPRSSARWRWL